MENKNNIKTDLEEMRHSTSHVLAMAVSELYPNVRLGIGPAVEDGFYYDFDMPVALNKDQLEDIEDKMYEIKSRELPFVQEVLPRQEAINLLNSRGQLYKTELIDDIDDKEISIYFTGESFCDLCRGSHVEHTGKICSFKLTDISGAYWKGDPSRPQMQRIKGYAFVTKEDLEEYLDNLEKTKEIDHRNLGIDLNLYITDHELGKGVGLWLSKGNFVKNRVTKFIVKKSEQLGYQNIGTPILISPSFEDEHYFDGYLGSIEIEGTYYLRRDMSIAHGIVYSRKPRTANQLPISYCEIGKVFSSEKSGELSGLYTSREFSKLQLTDFIGKNSFDDMFTKSIKFINDVYSHFGLIEYYVRINCIGKKGVYTEDEDWRYFEDAMKSYFDDKKIKYLEIEMIKNYEGPRVDFVVKDLKGKDIALSSIGVDLVVGNKINLTHVNDTGEIQKTYCMVTNPVISIDRFVGYVTEKQQGSYDYLSSPVQVVVIPIAERFNYFANQTLNFLLDNKIRAVFDDRKNKMQAKIRDAQLERIPFMLIIGQKEIDNDSVSLRDRSGKDLGMMKKEEMLKVLR